MPQTAPEPAAKTAAERNGNEPAQPELPVNTLREAAPYLRRPFDLHAVQFRALEGTGGERLNCAAYVTARTVIDRLNLVCPHLWEEPGYEQIPGGLRCDLTIDGKTRSDVGWTSGTATAMGLKALYSDAFKRAAVKFGVGVSLYALPRLVLEVSKRHAWAKKVMPEQKDKIGNVKYRYGITPAGMSELRARYDRWLNVQTSFGEALPHGHVEGSSDPEDETRPEADAASDVGLASDGDIKTLKQAAKGLVWAQVRMAFVAAGVSVPGKAANCFAGVPSPKVTDLAKELAAVPRKAST